VLFLFHDSPCNIKQQITKQSDTMKGSNENENKVNIMQHNKLNANNYVSLKL